MLLKDVAELMMFAERLFHTRTAANHLESRHHFYCDSVTFTFFMYNNNHCLVTCQRISSLELPQFAHRLRNDLYCVEWDVKLYHTIPQFAQFNSRLPPSSLKKGQR